MLKTSQFEITNTEEKTRMSQDAQDGRLFDIELLAISLRFEKNSNNKANSGTPRRIH